MNGFKRASRRQAAVVGLAVLMGASFLGCHAGPRLFSKKDRNDRAARHEQEFAERDSNKFINRKKVRPESDYRDDEQVAKSDRTTKPKAADSSRKAAEATPEKSVAARQRPSTSQASVSKSTKPSASPSKTIESNDSPTVARRENARRPVTDLLNDDSLFNDNLPATRSAAKGTANQAATAKTSVNRSKGLDEDPFKDSVIGSRQKSVATVNYFDDDDLDDEQDEEAEEQVVRRSPVAKVTPTQRPTAPTAARSQRKFLDDDVADVAAAAKSEFRSSLRDEPLDEIIEQPDLPSPQAAAKTAKTIAGQKVIDRRQEVQQTLNDWQRELNDDEPLDDSVSAPRLPSSNDVTRSAATGTSRGHLSQVSIEEFSRSEKSQGAVLNGELIIDTNDMSSRFQRPARSSADTTSLKGTTGRVNSNSGANIDIVPGATQSRPRPNSQITLQSGSGTNVDSGLTTADYEQPSDSSGLGKLPSLKLDDEASSGPKLSALEEESGVAPPPPEELGTITVGHEVVTSTSGSRFWKRSLLILTAMASAAGIGIALRRRLDMTPELARTPKPTSIDPQNPNSWPRG